MKISIIIPTFNRSHLIGKTIDSFLTQTLPNDQFEIIISNNNSTDDTSEILDRYVTSHSNIRSLFVGKQGVHYARNEASKIAKGEYLYFTDDDMIADRKLLSEMLDVLTKHPEIDVLTGKIIPMFLVPAPQWVTKFMINALLSLTPLDRSELLVISNFDVGVFSCHQLIRNTLFLRSGGFNPENTAGVWIGDGETGLNLKLKDLGAVFAYVSSSVIHHMIPKERMTLRYVVRRIGNQGFCDSYTEYRTHRNVNTLIQKNIRRNLYGAYSYLFKMFIRVIFNRNSWREFMGWINYFYKRNIYDFKLVVDTNFRKLVEVDDWLNNDDIKSN